MASERLSKVRLVASEILQLFGKNVYLVLDVRHGVCINATFIIRVSKTSRVDIYTNILVTTDMNCVLSISGWLVDRKRKGGIYSYDLCLRCKFCSVCFIK